jgi:hypothetical protein
MVSVHTRYAVATLLFGAFDSRCLSDNLVVDALVEAAFLARELYVNCRLSTWHNQYSDAVHHAVVPDVARTISQYGCSQKGEMC